MTTHATHERRPAAKTAADAPATPAGATGTVTIPVDGMTCAACSARVQRALQRAPGVADASVNLMLRNAVVSFDAAATSPDRLVDVIRDTGYGAELPAEDR